MGLEVKIPYLPSKLTPSQWRLGLTASKHNWVVFTLKI